MSQLTALPRPTARATRPSRGSAKAPRLRVVETKDAAEHTGVGFVVLCVLLLVGGLLSLLLLNTNRAQESFAIEKLQHKSATLTDQEQALTSKIDTMSSPQRLALQAQSMGLEPATKVRYVRKSDGTVLGVAKRSAKESKLTVDTLPSTPASRTAGVAVSAASSGLLVTKPEKKSTATKSSTSKTSNKPGEKARKDTSKKSTTTADDAPKSDTHHPARTSTKDDTSGGSAKSTSKSTK